jgi:hypothetical protein
MGTTRTITTRELADLIKLAKSKRPSIRAKALSRINELVSQGLLDEKKPLNDGETGVNYGHDTNNT